MKKHKSIRPQVSSKRSMYIYSISYNLGSPDTLEKNIAQPTSQRQPSSISSPVECTIYHDSNRFNVSLRPSEGHHTNFTLQHKLMSPNVFSSFYTVRVREQKVTTVPHIQLASSPNYDRLFSVPTENQPSIKLRISTNKNTKKTERTATTRSNEAF